MPKNPQRRAKEDGHPKRVAKYLRVSSVRQAETAEGSLDTQSDRLDQLIAFRTSENRSWQVVDTYREEGRSGKNLDRPEFQRMLSDIKGGLIDVVLVTKIDRITRSIRDFYTLWELFEEYGVEFISLNEQFDTTTPMGRFALKQLLLFAELEREVTSERTKDKMRWRAEQGLWNGSRVIGYSLDPERKGLLIPNPAEMDLVNTMFEACAREGSAGRTRDWLNKNGYLMPEYTSRRGRKHGGHKFNKQTVINILTNPLYIGKLRYGDEVHEGRHPAIVDTELFNRVQRILDGTRKRNRAAPRKGEYIYLLRGLLRCGKCGAAMVPSSAYGRNRTSYHYYQCSRRNHTGRAACDAKLVRAEAAEKLVLEYVSRIACNRKELDEIVVRSNKANHRLMRRLDRDRDAQERRINGLTAQRQNLVDSLASLGPKGAEAVREELESVQQDLEAAREALDSTRLEIEQLKSRTLDAEVMAGTLERFSQIVAGAEPAELQRLLPTVIKGMRWTEDTKTGEGLLEVFLWEEMQEVLVAPSAVSQRRSGEPLVVDGSSESQGWLPGQDSNLQPSG